MPFGTLSKSRADAETLCLKLSSAMGSDIFDNLKCACACASGSKKMLLSQVSAQALVFMPFRQRFRTSVIEHHS